MSGNQSILKSDLESILKEIEEGEAFLGKFIEDPNCFAAGCKEGALDVVREIRNYLFGEKE